MSMLLLNVLIAVAWMALTGRFSPLNFAVGFVLGYLILWFTQQETGPSGYFGKVPLAAVFVVFYLWELLAANIRVALSVISPGRLRPGIVAVPLDVESDAEIALLVNLVTLTPGTISLDVSADRRVLYIHAIDLGDPEQFRHEIKDKFERRVQELLS